LAQALGDQGDGLAERHDLDELAWIADGRAGGLGALVVGRPDAGTGVVAVAARPVGAFRGCGLRPLGHGFAVQVGAPQLVPLGEGVRGR
jgi:hypothetical protein